MYNNISYVGKWNQFIISKEEQDNIENIQNPALHWNNIDEIRWFTSSKYVYCYIIIHDVINIKLSL